MSKGVYFICVEGRKQLVKIGKSDNCERRVKQLQTGNPDRLYIYRIIESNEPFPIETALHRFYQKEKYQKGGGDEWYKVPKWKINRIMVTYQDGRPMISEKETWPEFIFRGIKNSIYFMGSSLFRK